MHKKKEQAVYNELKKLITTPAGTIINLGQLLQVSAQRFAQNIALIEQDKTISYQELFYRSSIFARTLKEKGINPRDRVLLFFENSIEFYIAYYAIAQLGAVVAPLNIFLKERELLHIINDAQPKLLVAHTQLLAKLKEDHIDMNVPVVTEQDMDLASPVDVAYDQSVPAHLQADEMAALLYTSGTTGLPKGVMLSAKNIFSNCVQTIARLGMVKDERVLGVLPFFHSFAQFCCVWAPFLMGCAVIIVKKIERRYILEGLTHNPTVFLGVPALFGLLCLMKNAPVDSVNYFASGGDAMPDKIRGSFEMIYQRKIGAGYGLSETSPVLTADLDDVTEPTDNVGRPLIGVQIAIRDAAGNQLPVDTIGQIWVKGDNVMLGYYNEPERTAQVLKDGWLDTGDLGYLNRKGKLVITGRIKDIIVNKGFKIYPQEIENVILMHPHVLQVGVVGIPDENVGEITVAFVYARGEQKDLAKQLRELCEQNLADYKVPRKFIISGHALPVTATGKVDKKILRTMDVA